MLSLSPKLVRMLLVEDNEDHAYLFRLALEEHWPDVDLSHTTSGFSAINYLKHPDNPTPDLIILDLKMPGMNGHDVLTALKLHSAWRKIPVIILTTSTTTHDRNLAYELHANSYLIKPVDTRSFKALVVDLHKYWSQVNQSPNDDLF